MDAAKLAKLGIDSSWLEPLKAAFERFEINTPQRQACFLGQCGHESGQFKTLSENLNYSAKGLRATWPKRFPTDADAEPYHRQPEKIANKVYAERMGNGNEASGEGWKYRGRGLIQLTGKDNYSRASKVLGVDLVAEPDKVATPQYAALTAAWFWSTNKLNALADKLDHKALTKSINGGDLGLDDRIKHSEEALKVLMG